MIFTGVDLETSGTDHNTTVPIQIGIAFLDEGEATMKSWYIGQWDWEYWNWDKEAAEVHGLTQEFLATQPDRLAQDIACRTWLDAVAPDHVLFMVGWNVAGFDRPFIEKHLPATFERFSYRTVDLNAICFALAVPYKRSYDWVKRKSKEYALERMEGDNWHDAGFDALASLYSFEFLKELAREGFDG